MTVEPKTRTVSILCSLETHQACTGNAHCECSCHYLVMARGAGEVFEERILWLAYELWAGREARLSWKQTRQVVYKFFKLHHSEHPLDDEVDETTDAIRQMVARSDWSRARWLDAFDARKVVTPTLF